MTYVRLEDGHPGVDASAAVVDEVAHLLGVDASRVEAAIRRSRRDHEALALFTG